MPTDFTPRAEIAAMVARMLLDVDAVRFDADRPFTFTSGVASPVYVDCRKLISHPRIRTVVTSFLGATVTRDIGFEAFDAVAGGETAGIPFAAWLAHDMGLPMQYVRKKPKGFGRAAQVEGDVHEGQRVLLVEDLTTDGGSKINFCNALRRAGARADHAIVIFYYDIFAQTRDGLDRADISLHFLATWRDVLAAAHATNHFDVRTLTEVEAFLNAPLDWSGHHGGATSINI